MGIYTETHPCRGCDKPVYGESYDMCEIGNEDGSTQHPISRF